MTSKTLIFGDWVKALRKERGLTRQEVAERSGGGISQQYIHFIESGRATNIGSDKLKALSEGLSVPIPILQQALFKKMEPQIPLIGRAAGGQATLPSPEEYEADFISYRHTGQDIFAVEMMGDSMAPKLEHGDLALVEPWRPEDPILSGWIYLFRAGQKLTCKYLIEQPEAPHRYLLVAAQPHLFPSIPLDDSYHILGRVIEVRKTHTLFRALLSDR